MNSGYGGSPSRALSTMSLSVRPVRNFASRSITRSHSFTGVNDNKPYRDLSVFSTPGLSRKPSRANRTSRMFTMANKPSPQPKVPQPERLDEIYEALKKGLQSYLRVHQMELDSLNRQMKESKRNSRLGFLYELDKQVKVTERYMRRLEFHLSKIEELYDTYCLQRRLRDGANKMVKAYTAYSPGSKEARECLTEANKGYKEYTETMCVLESELENHLGEFHVKMKGLAGFARLCAGDQYEIFMRYGRQRWKLRGRIEVNTKQVWDSEEVVFLPLISDFLCVKVTELKSLANHVVVGNVSCTTKDLFAALPQMVAVDINDLGTIKLSLEVTWNPFDKDDQGSVASAVNKAPTVSKRFSTIFNQSPPDTPSLHEQSFYNMLHCREELENGTAWCNSSESSDDSSSPQLSVGALRNSTHHKAVVVTPEIQPAGKGSCTPQPEITFCLRDSQTPISTQKLNTLSEDPITTQHQADTNRIKVEGSNSMMTEPENKDEDFGQQPPIEDCMTSNHTSHSYLRCLSHISESSSDGILLTDRAAGKSEEVMSLASGISINHTGVELPSRTPEPPRSAATDTDISQKGLSGVCENITAEDVTDQDPNRVPQNATSPSSQMNRHPECDALPQSGEVSYVARRVAVEDEEMPCADDSPVDCGLECALGAVGSSLDDYRGQFPELQLLEKELKMLQVTLKGNSQSSRSPSMASLTVETALGSFDFLNTSDLEEEEEIGDKRNRHDRSLQDRGWDSPSIPTSPLTTGCTSLDCSLVLHLKNCRRQLLRLGMFGPLRCGEMYALDRLLREARVLELIRHIMKDNPRRARLPTEVIPQLGLCPGAASLWQQCAGQASVYSVSAESFLVMLSTAYCCMLPEKAKSMANTVFQCLVERVLDQRLPQRGSNRNELMVTLFQLWSYLEANSISDMETHIIELAEEVCLVQRLTSCDQDLIIQTLRHPAECCLKKGGIQAVAKLLKDPRGKVSASASSVLRSLATQPRQREQALVSCLELLEDENADTRACGCKALSCLKAKESIDHLVYLCRTDKEEVRDAAKQTLLVLGEEGKMAHRHVEISQDSLPRLFAPGCMASTAF